MIGWLETILLAAFLAGLLNGVHCAAMCGGIIGAACGPRCGVRGAASRWRLVLGYNAGRITSYVAGGALAGALGEAGLALRGGPAVQQISMAAAGITLFLFALVISGCKPVERRLAAAGGLVWRCVQPWSRRFLPANNAARAYGLGVAWGWLPCGMVYAMLLTALATVSAIEGALVMLAFGLGTLPNVILIAVYFERVRGMLASPVVRMAAVAVLVSVGGFSLLQASRPAAATLHSSLLCMVIPVWLAAVR